LGAQIFPPAAFTAFGTDPSFLGSNPPATEDKSGLSAWSVPGAVRYMVRISGASFWITCKVLQSKDCTIIRRAMPALRISAIARRANSSGGSVAARSSGDTLVSQSKPTRSLPERFTQVEEVRKARNARPVHALLVGE
jgi:hypothetical protein